MTLSERNEASTRTDLIDTQLARAGWSRNRRKLIEEFLLKAAEPDTDYRNEQFADYVLLGSDGKPIAVVEAKRSARDEVTGKRQAADYADAIRAKRMLASFISRSLLRCLGHAHCRVAHGDISERESLL